MGPHFINVVVSGIRELTPRIREYCLTSRDGSALPPYQAGAHIEIYLNLESGPVTRHYSLVGGAATENDPPETYRIAVLRTDRPTGSAYIHQRFAVGVAVKISHPKSHFPLLPAVGKTLLLAGGIGITPVFGMLRSLVRRNRAFEIVYSCRDQKSFAYGAEVTRLAGSKATFHCSGEGAGRLDIEALLSRQPEGTVAYVCGPRGMIEATQRAAESLGWDPIRVRSELFAAGSAEDDCAFDVELRRSGRSIRVGRETTILDALTCAGVDALSDCRRGECGVCPLKVIETDGPIDHRDRFLSAEERERGDMLCICVSRIHGSHLTLDA